MRDALLKYQDIKSHLSVKQKVGQLFMLAVFINDTEEEVAQMEKLIRDHCIGALCIFHSRASAATNFEGKKKVVYNENSYDRLKALIDRYQKASEFPLLIAMDAEWGLAMRIENTPQYPYAITLGALQDQKDLIYEVGFHIGMDCKKAGIHWNLAPVVDINNNPENPVIGYRSFGDKKEEVKSKAGAYLLGMNDAGILNSLKHFPGHGDTATDSHLGLPVIDKSKKELFENELYPFIKLLKEEVDSVMVAHLSLPQLDASENPSTTSKNIITGLLRDEIGFEGVIISDALNMHAVSKRYLQKGGLEVAAFNAGMDMLCFSEHPVEGISQILDSGSKDAVEKSFKRIWRLKEKVFGGAVSEDKAPSLSHKDLNREIAKNCITELWAEKKPLKDWKEHNFLNLSCGTPIANIFSEGLEKELGSKHYHLGEEAVHEEEHQNAVLALFPPSVKPKNNFGIESHILENIQKLISKNEVTVYLFGNPYVLDVLEGIDAADVIVFYQDFPDFQEVALQHFLGKIPALGELPVQLKTLQS
ncbi:glycoside hydrolase family 3 protein [Flagellimonas allohymeniacidonis]|uniref:beta-N-acetylhexosaminidase n=1 Tax=Flagellimonas allohymeniacidonis TaxID=2517819 RepID=A0A4V2HSW2_9FLAO|nr:glycoside hydrolase family 3 N-terminal domain-containing protein [Allomuricauda hymeniacidonis]TAI49290.1 glycoside hydrolase family 3 protein [Allomuricauda hymeniacidonis]